MKKFLLLIAATAFALLTTACTDSSGYTYETVKNDPLKTRIYTLDNGLKVYMSVNKAEPRIETYIAVKVGGKNDPSETTGLAHYFEHLMFKGTQQFGTSNYEAEKPLLDQIEQLFEVYRKTTDDAERAAIYRQINSISYEASKYAIPNEYDKLMSAIGALETNANTSMDRTVYIENIPSNQIENWARIQADRFKNVVIRGFHTELETIYEEKNIGGGQYGVPLLILGVILLVACVPLIIFGAVQMGESWRPGAAVLGGAAIGLGIAMPIVGLVLLCGLKVVKPNEALVLTLFGKYYGTLKGAGFYFVNPFCTAVNPTVMNMQDAAEQAAGKVSGGKVQKKGDRASGKAISLKAITLDNGKQKINDAMGNPIEIGIVVIWRVVNTAKAVFSVDNYMDFLSIQADSALRNIVRLYPYDVSEEGDELSLRGSSQEVAERLKTEIQSKVELAGLEVLEARITHLAYAPEIAAAMLQRQQAAAIIDARKMIVDGAVGMVTMALEKLGEEQVVELDEERKAAMISNLLVVLCGNKDAQPVVNSGSLY